MEAFIDNFFGTVVSFITNLLSSIVGFVFSNPVTTLITGFFLLNGLGYFLMYHDKKLAQYNGKTERANSNLDEKALKKLLRRRIPERTLMLTALVGGSLGILGGMYKFNHKTQKPLFKYGVPIIIGLQIIFIIWRIVVALTTNSSAI